MTDRVKPLWRCAWVSRAPGRDRTCGCRAVKIPEERHGGVTLVWDSASEMTPGDGAIG